MGGCLFTSSLLLFSITATAVSARVVVNELYYDHPGADAGHEFVELVDTDDAPADIGGLSLEFHNGSGSGWVVLWRAAPGTVLRAGAPFVIGASLVSPVPDVVVSLSLQNGPDAIRIVAADGTVLDLVGYGGLDDPLHAETKGAAAVPAGASIARVPDGVDTDDNSADFRAATPTPGRYNVARHDAGLAPAPGVPMRGARDAAGTELIALLISNHGTAGIPARAVRVSALDSSATGVTPRASVENRGAIAPGGFERAELPVALDRGYHWISLRAEYAPDERPGNDSLTIIRRVGRLSVLVSEVWSAPRSTCPQFVELYNAGTTPVDVGGWALRDMRASPVTIATDSLVLAPRTFVAVSASPAALVACVPRTPGDRVVGVDGSWPVFNRSGSGIADSVVVLDRHGIVTDAVAYPPLGTGISGRSLERVDLYDGTRAAVWRLSPSSDGCTPGLPNQASLYDAPVEGELDAGPNPFAPARGELLRIAVHAGAAVARVVVSVFDTAGRRVADVGSATSLPVVFLWDGRDRTGHPVRAGLYVVACEDFLADGTRGAVRKVVVGCAGGEH